jgi:hypothetical protein
MESADNNTATKIDEATRWWWPPPARPPSRTILFRTALTQFNNQAGSFSPMLLLVYNASARSVKKTLPAESERDFLFRLRRQLL